MEGKGRTGEGEGAESFMRPFIDILELYAHSINLSIVYYNCFTFQSLLNKNNKLAIDVFCLV